MKITNRLGLPEPIVRAVTPKKDPETRRGGADISVTELIGPPRVKQLQDLHWDDMEADVADLLYALDGTVVHDILKRNSSGDEFAEERLRMAIEVDGRTWVVSGQFDLITGSGARDLMDYKRTSVWRRIFGAPEWEEQLNLYRLLLVENGIPDVTSIKNILFYRDWSRSEMLRSGDGYPREKAEVLVQRMWPIPKIRAFAEGRLRAHAEKMPRCTKEEMIEKGAKLAVRVVGAKKALRLFEPHEQDEADRFAIQYQQQYPGKQLEYEDRQGERVRCKEFCKVWQFCEFGLEARGKIEEP